MDSFGAGFLAGNTLSTPGQTAKWKHQDKENTPLTPSDSQTFFVFAAIHEVYWALGNFLYYRNQEKNGTRVTRSISHGKMLQCLLDGEGDHLCSKLGTKAQSVQIACHSCTLLRPLTLK